MPLGRRPVPLPTSISTMRRDPHGGSPAGPDGDPRVLMLGMGWFPATLGGLNRYYRSLLEQLPEARGVVIGPAGGRARVDVLDGPEIPLPRRLLDFWLAARRAAPGAEVVDAHLALYAAVPLLLGGCEVVLWCSTSTARGRRRISPP